MLVWFDRHGRHDLPWQHPRTPYRVWVAEVMLQQTQVRTVIPYFEAFLTRFPELPALAAAELDAVLAAWSGLGYYRRARHLHQAAGLCMERHGGSLPGDFASLAALPGIGRSTAGAILAQAHGQRHAILDANVRRVLSRHAGIDSSAGAASLRRLWALAEERLPQRRLADYTQALMDLGASTCRPRQPDCSHCPWSADCALARAEGGAQALATARRSRRERRHERRSWLLLRDRSGRILLQRRPPLGIWAELWSPLEAADDASVLALAGGIRALSEARLLAELSHELTHFTLQLRCLLLECEAIPGIAEASTRWCTATQALELGLPQPARRLIEGLGSDGESDTRCKTHAQARDMPAN